MNKRVIPKTTRSPTPIYPFRDKQQDPPITYCEKCQQEIWREFMYCRDGLILCKDCYDMEKRYDREAKDKSSTTTP